MSFETTFFGPGNRLRWDAIRSGELPKDAQDRLGPFLDELELSLDPHASTRAENGQVSGTSFAPLLAPPESRATTHGLS